MKKLIVLLVFSISTLAFTQSKERISLHVFDLPTGITIEEFQNDLDRANKIYEKNGFGANKYKVYQVSSDDEAKEHRYMWLSTWANLGFSTPCTTHNGQPCVANATGGGAAPAASTRSGHGCAL